MLVYWKGLGYMHAIKMIYCRKKFSLEDLDNVKLHIIPLYYMLNLYYDFKYIS